MTSPPKPLADDEQPDVACPHCTSRLGKPVSVSTRQGELPMVDIEMRCASCGETWIVQKLTHDIPPI